MNFKLFLKILFFSFLIMFLTMPLRISPLGFTYSSVIGFIVFFYFSLFCLQKFNSRFPVWKILIALILGQWIFELPMRIAYFEQTLISLPDTLHRTLGIICGFLYWRWKSPLNIAPVFIGCLIAVFMFFQGWDYWVYKLNFGTFNGKVEASALPIKFEVFDESKNLILDDNFQNKIVLLDFWNTGCGVCFEKFPQLQAFHEKYRNDNSVMVFAVNKPFEEDKPKQAFEMIRERNLTFPVVITKDEDLAEKFGVKGYPTTFVINRNKQIVYKGDIEGAIRMVDELKLSSR